MLELICCGWWWKSFLKFFVTSSLLLFSCKHGMISSPNIIWVVKSRIMSWAGQVACRGRWELHVGFFLGANLRGRDHLRDVCINERVILKWIFKKWDWGHRLDWSGSGLGQVAGSCEFSNETLGSMKWRNLLTSRGTVGFSSRALLHIVGWLGLVWFGLVWFGKYACIKYNIIFASWQLQIYPWYRFWGCKNVFFVPSSIIIFVCTKSTFFFFFFLFSFQFSILCLQWMVEMPCHHVSVFIAIVYWTFLSVFLYRTSCLSVYLFLCLCFHFNTN